jgi:hypothetical protein
LELLDAQNTLTEAQTNAASAGYDVRIAQARLRVPWGTEERLRLPGERGGTRHRKVSVT